MSSLSLHQVFSLKSVYEEHDESVTSPQDDFVEIDSTMTEFLSEDEYNAVDPMIYNYSTNYVFPKSYCGIFEGLCKKFGKILEHQSD